MKKENKKTWDSPKLLNLENSNTEAGALPGAEGRRLTFHMPPSIPFTMGTERSIS
jgi:hypothetical protein